MLLFIIISTTIISLMVLNLIVLIDIKILLNQFYNIRNTKSKQFANSTNDNDSNDIY